jgi:hypothetical protein
LAARVGEAFDAGEAGFGDAPLAAAFGSFVDLGGEHLGQERHVAHLGALGDLGQVLAEELRRLPWNARRD